MTRYSNGAAARADREISNIVAFNRDVMLSFMFPKLDIATGRWGFDPDRKKPLRRGAPKGSATIVNGVGTFRDRNGDDIRIYTSFLADQRHPKYHADSLREHRAKWGCGKLKKGTPAWHARQAEIASRKDVTPERRMAA